MLLSLAIFASLAAATNSALGIGKTVAEIIQKYSKPSEDGSTEQNAAKAFAQISSMMGTGMFPVFDGRNYETWRHMMKALLISHDLWDLVEQGYKEKGRKAKDLKKDREMDAMALLIIMRAVDESVCRCTVHANTSKEAWDAIQNKYLNNYQGPIAGNGIGIARVAIGIVLAAIAIFMYEKEQVIKYLIVCVATIFATRII